MVRAGAPNGGPKVGVRVRFVLMLLDKGYDCLVAPAAAVAGRLCGPLWSNLGSYMPAARAEGA